MAMRLSKLELVCDAQRKEIKEKVGSLIYIQSAKIRSLEEELEAVKTVSSSSSIAEFKSLREQFAKVTDQVKEMEEFLADYGLVWVGKNAADKSQFKADKLNKDIDIAGPAYRNNLPSEIDLNVIVRRIEELNFIAEKSNVQQVVKKEGVHRLEKPRPVVIVFFRNGLAMKAAGGFHPYYSKQAQSILSDILDGYFPYDLKKSFPDGAFLNAVDRTETVFDPEQTKHGNIEAFADLEVKEAMAPTKEEFLAQFPKHIMKKGQVIPIREELEKKFDPKKSLTKFHMNPVITSEDLEAKVASLPPEEIVTLRVRTERGTHSLILKFSLSDTMSTVYQVLDGYSESGGKGKYEVRSKFPTRAFDRFDPSSLGELGLAPHSALIMHQL